MLIDSKKLWVEGGYALHNPYEIFIARVRLQAKSFNVSHEDLELILISFFMDLRKDPKMYRTENNECLQCACGITNSGTNATHYIFKQLELKRDELILLDQERFTNVLNEKILTYINEDNERYTAEFGPDRDPYWYEIPTFKKWGNNTLSFLRIK